MKKAASYGSEAGAAAGTKDSFNANPDEFAYVFALVDLGRNGDGDLAWLAPTAFDFAYYEGADATDSYLGVLCMTEGRPTPPRNGDPQPPLDGNAVPAGQGAALDISGERFMNRMVLPGLIRQFRASVGDFTEQPDGSLTSDSLDMNPITELGGTYYPHVTSLRVFMEAAELHVDMDVHIHVHPGIEVYVSLSHSLAPQLAAKGDRQYIVYQGAELSRHTRWTIEWWAEVEEFFMPVVTGLTTLGASMAADAVLQIMAIIAVDSATVAVQWTNLDEFVAGVVSLNGGLQIAGGYVG
ncbi:TULIP family P47-like protein [Streptomyces griseoruber]